MSADSWDTCPSCFHKAEEEHKAEVEEVMALYGHIPVEEFDKERENLTEAPHPDAFKTFREDYEFYGAIDGVIHAKYKGGCNVCHLRVELTAEKEFWTKP